MSPPFLQRTSARWAGLSLGTLAFAVNIQLGQILPYQDCGSAVPGATIAAAANMAVALLGAFVSWRAASAIGAQGSERAAGEFFSRVSALAALVFAFALMLQGVSSWLVDACAR